MGMIRKMEVGGWRVEMTTSGVPVLFLELAIISNFSMWNILGKVVFYMPYAAVFADREIGKILGTLQDIYTLRSLS